MNIKALRTNAKLTQHDIANALGYKSESIVSLWESNHRTPPTRILPNLAAMLGCTVDDLLRTDCNANTTPKN